MKIRPVLRCPIPAYPAIAVAALAAASAFAADKPIVLKGRPVPRKPTQQSGTKPRVTLGLFAAPLPPRPVVEGTHSDFSNPAFVSATMLADRLGVRVIHAPDKVEWTLELNSRRIVLTPGKLDAIANGKPVRLPVRPILRGRTLYVPVRAVSEALGLTVAQRGTDIALRTPVGRRMLILRDAPVKPPPAPGMGPRPRLSTPAAPPARKR